MNKFLMLIISVAVSIASIGLCRAQSDAPYTEGPVWTITMVKAKAGMTDEYLKGLAKTLRGTLDEAKKQDLIMDYKILLGNDATPQDFDILIMVDGDTVFEPSTIGNLVQPLADPEPVLVTLNPVQAPAEATVIIQASRLERWKGQELLLRALGRLTDVSGWMCWIAGGAQRPAEADYLAELRLTADRFGLAERVRFLGQRSDVPHLLRFYQHTFRRQGSFPMLEREL